MTYNLFSVWLLVALVGSAICYRVPPSDVDWAIAKQKAVQFVAALNLTEKVSLATGVGWYNGQCVGNTPSIPRVNFEGFCLQDSPTGVRLCTGASAFPAAINVATSWNRTLIYERAAAMGAEFRGKGVHVALAPMMNLGRVAAGGRNWEGFGADPYLQGAAAYESVLGIQDQGVVACAKHFIGNEQEHYRTSSSSNIDDRTLHELYLWPFMRSVQAGVGSVMCSYNKVNNTYACQNGYTLNTVLKGTLGFRGYVMSDWAATMSGVPSVNAGLDMTMPGDITFGSGTTYFGQNLVSAVTASAQVTAARVDDMAIRIMTPYFLLGQDQAYPSVSLDFRNLNYVGNNVQADHNVVIRKIGQDSAVLLKNVGQALPFTSSISGNAQYTFAVIGGDAGPIPGGPNAYGDRGNNAGLQSGTVAVGWGSGTTQYPYLITPLVGITNRAASNQQNVTSSLFDNNYPSAIAAAQSANVAIVCVMADSGEGYITVEGNAGDRNNLELWHNGSTLIQQVASVNNNTVVVIHAVGPVNVTSWINHPNVTAVVLAGMPGQESGNSLADVLFGDVNPSGKLVYTIAKNRNDYPADVIYTSSTQQINYSEKLLIDYRWFDANNIQPVFPFGFGLSYTSYTYTNLQITSVGGLGLYPDLPKIGTLPVEQVLYEITVNVTNSGSVAGEEIVQLYLSFPPEIGEPPKILRGFDKVFVGVGQTVTASFTLTYLEMSYYDVTSASWKIPSGNTQVLIGASSRDIRLTGVISV